MPRMGVWRMIDMASPVVNPLRAGMRSARTVEPATMVIFGATGDLKRDSRRQVGLDEPRNHIDRWLLRGQNQVISILYEIVS